MIAALVSENAEGRQAPGRARAAGVEKTKRLLRGEPPGPYHFACYGRVGCGYAVDGRDGLAFARLADSAM